MKVSVNMITYNHERFIAQAIESALMQQVDFDYEIVIGEDCSTDRTREIVVDYQRRYPDRIRLLLHENNVGGRMNLLHTRQASRGEYIAILEGDDYWTSPHKLQKQVDFLDNQPECSICFHNVNITNEDSSEVIREAVAPGQKEFSTLRDLVETNPIPTCSTMYRRGLINDYPDWYFEVPIGDWPLHILNAQHGQVGYINEILGVYRKHSGGAWTRFGHIGSLQARILFYEAINAHLNYEYDDIVRSKLSYYWDGIAVALVERGVELGLEQVNIEHVRQIFDNWPPKLSLPEGWETRIWGQIYERLFFAHYSALDLAKTRYSLLKLAQYDSSLLKKRGVWSIALRAFGGQQMISWLRRVARQENLG